MSSDREVMECLYRNLEHIADHCMSRFRISNDRSLVKELEQFDQISNRSALICWIGEQLLDPEIDETDDLCLVMCERLALILVDKYPHRWASIMADVLREDPLPNFVFLVAMQRVLRELR